MFNDKRVIPLPRKRDAFTAIRRFMCDEDVKLKAEEELILDRWIYCDVLLRKKELNEEQIIDDIAKKFSVSVYTARNDIGYTQRLFAASRKLNKKYLIDLHLKRMDEDIEKIRKRIFQLVDENGEITEITPDAKEMAAYAKLLETYTYTLNSVPEDAQEEKQPPPIFHFILAPGQVIDKPMQLEDALKKADAILLTQKEDGVYSADQTDEE